MSHDNNKMSTHVLIAVMVVLFLHIIVRLRRPSDSVRVHLIEDALGNEVLIAVGTISGKTMLFMVDTAFAGAPVLSTSYLSLPSPSPFLSLEKQYRFVVDGLHNRVTPDSRHRALSQLLSGHHCRAFTSGCTMRLMGIGSTSESQSDLLLCDGVRFNGGANFNSDVFVTNSLPSSVHILTMDFLLHRSPCVIMPRRGVMQWQVTDYLLRSSFEMHEPFYVGGAMRVPMTIGGSALNIVIDTGAAIALSVASSSLDKIQRCDLPVTSMKAVQRGVNGERVCSDMFSTTVSIGRLDLGRVNAFANNNDVEGADGYAGMGLLRMLDLWIEPRRIGFRLSGLEWKTSSAVSEGTCGATRRTFACTAK